MKGNNEQNDKCDKCEAMMIFFFFSFAFYTFRPVARINFVVRLRSSTSPCSFWWSVV